MVRGFLSSYAPSGFQHSSYSGLNVSLVLSMDLDFPQLGSWPGGGVSGTSKSSTVADEGNKFGYPQDIANVT
jgi:hypothetical protein